MPEFLFTRRHSLHRTRLAVMFVGVGLLLVATPAQAGLPIDMEVSDEHNCVITDCDTTLCWGRANQFFGEDADQARPYVDIAVGNDHSCGLVLHDPAQPSRGGAVECWGRTPGIGGADEPDSWSLTEVPPGDYKQIDGGAYLTCGIRADPQNAAVNNTVECWGWDKYGVTNTVPRNPRGNVVKFSQVSAGYGFACGVTTGASAIYCWGDAPGGLTRLPIDDVKGFKNETWQKVSAGTNHVCALSDYNDGFGGGATYCWGANNAGQVVSEPWDGSHAYVEVVPVNDDSVDVSRTTFPDPNDPTHFDYAFDVVAGMASTCVVRDQRNSVVKRIECWGYPFTPAEFDLTLWSPAVPAPTPPLPALFNPDAVFLSVNHLCALDKVRGELECWSLTHPTPMGILDTSDPACDSIACTADDLNICL